MATTAIARQLDLRGLTISTAIAWAAREELAGLAVGDEVELLVDAFPAIVPELQAWCRATGARAGRRGRRRRPSTGQGAQGRAAWQRFAGRAGALARRAG